MVADVALDDFSHEAVHRATNCNHEMEHFGAALLRFERAVKRFDLAANTADAVKEFFFVAEWYEP